MLYRIQTLYLFISVLIYSVFLYYFFPFLFSFKRTIFVFLIICLIISILSLLSFKKKKFQILMNQINIIINSIHLILFFYQSNQLLKRKMALFFVLLCFCSICILYMANKAIRKDIELIDSMSRIR
ncbi:DUF4293 family protein [Blattabacterium cuenoti]|uniref:DUF4293 family protein n=1 Tax=Blattabacterium cuenoti TaxID=1653831 RepID=UPI00163D1295|nr:DUF4293 family protein [Blattabacterium cuenoti]